MEEFGIPINPERIDTIERLATLLASSFKILTGVTYEATETDVSKTGERYSSMKGEANVSIPNAEALVKVTVKLFFFHYQPKRYVVYVNIGSSLDCLDFELQFEHQQNGEILVHSSI